MVGAGAGVKLVLVAWSRALVCVEGVRRSHARIHNHRRGARGVCSRKLVLHVRSWRENAGAMITPPVACDWPVG